MVTADWKGVKHIKINSEQGWDIFVGGNWSIWCKLILLMLLISFDIFFFGATMIANKEYLYFNFTLSLVFHSLNKLNNENRKTLWYVSSSLHFEILLLFPLTETLPLPSSLSD